MSAPISRRRIVAGAGWTVPVVLLGAAAPAAAASASCPVLTGYQAFQAVGDVYVSFSFGNVTGNSQLVVTSVTGPGFGAFNVNAPNFSPQGGTPQVTLTHSAGGGAGTITINYEIVVDGQRTCSGYSLQIPYPLPPPPPSCPVLQSYSAFEASDTVYVSFDFDNVSSQSQLVVTSVTGPGFGTFNVNAPNFGPSGGTAQVTLPHSPSGAGTLTIAYEILVEGGERTCSGYTLKIPYPLQA